MYMDIFFKIHLKPDAVSKHQRPYKLPPHKRDVLRHQLDELLSQGKIAPVNEKEHIPISSPIVLVSRYRKACVLEFRYRKSTQNLDINRLPSFEPVSNPEFGRFLCSFRQSKTSTSILPSILDFSTCMFNGLPMGLKTSSNSFQLLKNKVLNGLSFRNTLCYF
jgi:hypothetical protein